jgi:hypothetical protein
MVTAISTTGENHRAESTEDAVAARDSGVTCDAGPFGAQAHAHREQRR